MSLPRRVAATLLTTLLATTALTGCGDNDKDGASGDRTKAASSEESETPSIDPAIAALPAAAADLLIAPYSDEADGNSINPGEAGTFLLPGESVSIPTITTLDSVVDVNDSGEKMRAADGERLLLIDLATSYPDNYEYTRPVTQVLIEDAGRRVSVYDSVDAAEPFVVSVGDDAALVLAADGRDFRASLGPDDLGVVEEAGRLGEPRQDVAQLMTFKKASAKDGSKEGEASFSAKVAAVVLTPFLPAELNDGTPTWAADGRLFLLIEVDAANTQLSGDLSNLEETTQTWSTEVDGVKATARGPLSFGGFRSSGVAVLDVPADARSFTLTASATSIASFSLGATVTLAHGKQALDVQLP